jgi:methyl coenzyme M reductase subunit C
MMMITKRVLMGTQPAASLHWRSTAEEATKTTVTYVTSSAGGMHTAKLKIGVEIRSVKSKNSAMKGTMITMVLITTNLTGSDHQKRGISQEASRHTVET